MKKWRQVIESTAKEVEDYRNICDKLRAENEELRVEMDGLSIENNRLLSQLVAYPPFHLLPIFLPSHGTHIATYKP